MQPVTINGLHQLRRRTVLLVITVISKPCSIAKCISFLIKNFQNLSQKFETYIVYIHVCKLTVFLFPAIVAFLCTLPHLHRSAEYSNMKPLAGVCITTPTDVHENKQNRKPLGKMLPNSATIGQKLHRVSLILK